MTSYDFLSLPPPPLSLSLFLYYYYSRTIFLGIDLLCVWSPGYLGYH